MPHRKSLVRHPGLRDLLLNRFLYVMVLPAVLFSALFAYLPLGGIAIAFQDFHPIKGIFGSPFVGLKNFEFFFRGQDWLFITFNTVFLNALFIVTGTALAVALAILISELGRSLFVRTAQSVMILPNFIAWPIVGLFSVAFLSVDTGVVDKLLGYFGKEGVDLYMTPSAWPAILIVTNLWKTAGFGAIVYLAAIAGQDKGLIEAARIDGAGRLQCIRYVTLPQLKSTIVMLFLLGLGGIFVGNLDMIYSLVGDNPFLYPTTDVIDTYIFRALRSQGRMGMTQAIALYQSVVGFVLVLLANLLVKKLDDSSSIF